MNHSASANPPRNMAITKPGKITRRCVSILVATGSTIPILLRPPIPPIGNHHRVYLHRVTTLGNKDLTETGLDTLQRSNPKTSPSQSRSRNVLVEALGNAMSPQALVDIDQDATPNHGTKIPASISPCETSARRSRIRLSCIRISCRLSRSRH